MFRVTINASVRRVQFLFAEWGTRRKISSLVDSRSFRHRAIGSISIRFELASSLGILVCIRTKRERERDSNAKVRFALTASRRRRNNELRRLRVAPRLYSRPWITEFGGITRGGVKTPRARERYTDAQTDASRDCPGVG